MFFLKHGVHTCRQTDRQRHRRNSRRAQGDWFLPIQVLGWGNNNVLVSQPFGCSFQKKQEISQQVVTRMQDLASEFSKKFSGGDTPRHSQREGATSSRTQNPARPLAQTLVPSTFQPWLRPWTEAYEITTSARGWSTR